MASLPAPATQRRQHNIYQDCLDFCEEQAAAEETQHDGIATVCKFLAATTATAANHKRIAALSSEVDAGPTINCRDVVLRTGRVKEASALLSQILASKRQIQLRLKDSTMKQSIPIDRPHQEDFRSFLASCAYNTAMLRQGVSGLQWTRQLRDDPNFWESHLQPVSNITRTSEDYMKALCDRSLTLQRAASCSGLDGTL